MDLAVLLLQILVIIVAPLVVGLSTGVDRKITARLQNRRGPPIIQPFYDIGKLLLKRPMLINNLQVVFAGATLLFHAVGPRPVRGRRGPAGRLLRLRGRLGLPGDGGVLGPVAVLVHRGTAGAAGHLRLRAGAVPGGPVHRPPEFLPGRATSAAASCSAFRWSWLALVPVLVILLEKSPYDIPTAHQEIITGPYIEYSGPYLAIMEVARWFHLAFIYGLFTLFIWSDNVAISVLGKVAIAFVALFATIIIDNITARLTRERMVVFMLTAGVGLVAINLLVLFIFRGVV